MYCCSTFDIDSFLTRGKIKKNQIWPDVTERLQTWKIDDIEKKWPMPNFFTRPIFYLKVNHLMKKSCQGHNIRFLYQTAFKITPLIDDMILS